MKKARLAFFGAAICYGAFLVAGCSQNTSVPGDEPIAQGEPRDSATSEPQETAPAPDPQNTKVVAPPVQPVPTFSAPISWHTNWNQGFAQAKAQHKPVMVDFYAEWCGPCKWLEKEVYTQGAVIQEASHFVTIKIDVDRNPDLNQKYQVSSLPSIVFFDASGKVLADYRGSGAPDVPALVKWMQDAYTQSKGTPA
jgi:thiol-disulfide isomerase/thioredoxin